MQPPSKPPAKPFSILNTRTSDIEKGEQANKGAVQAKTAPQTLKVRSLFNHSDLMAIGMFLQICISDCNYTVLGHTPSLTFIPMIFMQAGFYLLLNVASATRYET